MMVIMALLKIGISITSLAILPDLPLAMAE
jgi:hypothetical protein